MGSKTTSQVTNAPNPTATSAYNDVVGQAQSVASTPYSPYSGQLVAPLGPAQDASINQLLNSYGSAQPEIDQGESYLASGAQGLGGVQNYLQSGSDATAGAAGYQGMAGANYNTATGFGEQSEAALGGMQPYMRASGSAVGSAQEAYGQEQSGLGAAAGYFGQAANLATPQQFSAAAVQQYENPYTQSVIDSTMANLNENDAEQSQQQTAGDIGAGAYGGDRAAVGQAELGRQQDLANNQTVAGLESQNYSQALGQFNTTQTQNQQGASLLAGLGSAQTQNAEGYGNVGSGELASASGYNALAQDAGQQAQQLSNLGSLSNATGTGYTGLASDSLGQASAYGSLGQLEGQAGTAYGQLGNIAGYLGQSDQGALISSASAGLQGSTLAQQNNQQQDTAAYNQYMAGLSYPYQNTGFLSNIVQGIGSQEGNTATTQGNALSSIAGLGVSSLGILGATGAFGSSGYLTGASGLGSTLSSAFSDERIKDDKSVIGATFDGQPIYRFRYKGDPKVQMGLMAQDVEKRDPGAVGSLGGIKTVDYDRATRGAAQLGLGDAGRFSGGGAVSPGLGGVRSMSVPGGGLGAAARMARAAGGAVVGMGLGTLPLAAAPLTRVRNGASDHAHADVRTRSAAAFRRWWYNSWRWRPVDDRRSRIDAWLERSRFRVAEHVAVGAHQSRGGPCDSSNTARCDARADRSGAPATRACARCQPFARHAGIWLTGTCLRDVRGQHGFERRRPWIGFEQRVARTRAAAGAGMASGTSMSFGANVGQGITDGLKTYNTLNQQDRSYGLQQQDMGIKQGDLALANRRENFSEAQAQRLIDAARAVSGASAQQSGAAADAVTAGSAPSPVAGIAPLPSANGAAAVAQPLPLTGSASPAAALPIQRAGTQRTFSVSASAPRCHIASVSDGRCASVRSGCGVAHLRRPRRASGLRSHRRAIRLGWHSSPPPSCSRARSTSPTGLPIRRTSRSPRLRVSRIAGGRSRRAASSRCATARRSFLPGYATAAAQKSAATAQGTASVTDQHDLVSTQPTPGGPTYSVPKAQVLSDG